VLNETVYVGFSTGTNIVSRLICKMMGAPYSHVYVNFPSLLLNRDIIYEASHFSVAFSGKTSRKVVKEYKLEVPEAVKVKTLQFAIDHLGAPYGVMQLVGFMWVILCRKFGKKVKNPIQNGPKAYVCSEIVAEMLKHLGYPMEGDMDTITPKDVDEFLTKMGVKQTR
jgi:hypothetical protein